MATLPPGIDPVADHTWCCEHPEPWHYFQPEAEQRLLSGLMQVYRIDPIEASWSLGIVSWTASDAAIPVLQKITEDRVLSPKQQRIADEVLRCLRDEDSTPEAHGEPVPEESPDTSELLQDLQHARNKAKRRRIADELVQRFRRKSGSPYSVEMLCEIVSERHEDAHILVKEALESSTRLSLNTDTRGQLLLACATWGHTEALPSIKRLLTSSENGVHIYDVYEAIKALRFAPPSNLDKTAREDLFEILRQQPWWRPSTADEAGQIHVTTAALLGQKGQKLVPTLWKQRLRWPGKHMILRRYQAEALGFIGGRSSIARLTSMLRDRQLSIRQQAARSMYQIGSPKAAEALIRHVALDIISGAVPFDIEGVQVIRYTIDMIVQTRHPNGPEVLATLLDTPEMRADDVPSRAAVALCLFGDDRCMRLREDSGLPEAIHAALSPFPKFRGDLLEEHTHTVGEWLQERYALPLSVSQPPLAHMDRVRLSREMLAWWNQQVNPSPPAR